MRLSPCAPNAHRSVGCKLSLQRHLLLQAPGCGFCADEEDGANQIEIEIEIEMRDRPTLTKGGVNGSSLFCWLLQRVVTLWDSRAGYLHFALDTSKEDSHFENTCYKMTQSIFYITRLLCETHNTKTAIGIYCYKLFKM